MQTADKSWAVTPQWVWHALSDDMPSIVSRPNVMGGIPRISGSTISVAQILGLLESGLTMEQVAAEFPGYVTIEDVRAALQFAARLAGRDTVANH